MTKRKQRVFGRRKVTVEGHEYAVEMRDGYITIRRRYKHRVSIVGLDKLIKATEGILL